MEMLLRNIVPNLQNYIRCSKSYPPSESKLVLLPELKPTYFHQHIFHYTPLSFYKQKEDIYRLTLKNGQRAHRNLPSKSDQVQIKKGLKRFKKSWESCLIIHDIKNLQFFILDLLILKFKVIFDEWIEQS